MEEHEPESYSQCYGFIIHPLKSISWYGGYV